MLFFYVLKSVIEYCFKVQKKVVEMPIEIFGILSAINMQTKYIVKVT